MTTLAWHFLRADGLLRDGSAVPADGIERYEGSLVLCESGLHASVLALDALKYAPGPIVRRVECSGGIRHDIDKLICPERRELWRADATDALRLFARQCAGDALHLWDAPPVVREWLRTGDESLRAAAWAAAWAAARDAARAAASAAAWAAASAAARDAARGAASAAAWAAAWDAARDAQNARLEAALLALEPKETP